MNGALVHVLELELIGDAGAVFPDLARDHGINVEVIASDEAELRRVKAASRDEYVALADPIPYAPRWVRCGGLRAISPSEGGHLKGWLAARVAWLWRRRRDRTLFEYTTKKPIRLADGTRVQNVVRKSQRWETRDFIDLAEGDSPPHLSGFHAPRGKAKLHKVSGPRAGRLRDEQPPELTGTTQFDFTGGT